LLWQPEDLPPPIHDRYRGTDVHSDLTKWANDASSPRIGYYARPPNLSPAVSDLGNAEEAMYLNRWLADNQGDGAEAFYIDTIATGYQGSPQAVHAALSDPRFVADTVVEGTVDIYPVASLLFGDLDLNGGIGLTGGPQGPSSDHCEACLYAPMSRYLMADRLAFILKMDGEDFWADDGDGYNDTDCDPQDWGVRQAFLLGLKIAYWPILGEDYANSTIKQVNDLRVSFWAQGPTYLHQYRLGGLTTDVDARTFRMSNGTYRVAVENCAGVPRTITFAGVARSVPPGLSLQSF
jgi:hypothetical protein